MWSEIRPEQRKKGMKQKSSHSFIDKSHIDLTLNSKTFLSKIYTTLYYETSSVKEKKNAPQCQNHAF